MRTIPAQTAACGESNFIANASCCTVPSRACGWPINVRVSDFLGVALRGLDDAQMLVLVHRDPSLNIPLCVSSDREEIASAWQMWSDIFALPQLPEDEPHEPAARRRRHNAIRARRPKFLVRRRASAAPSTRRIFTRANEIIGRGLDPTSAKLYPRVPSVFVPRCYLSRISIDREFLPCREAGASSGFHPPYW